MLRLTVKSLLAHKPRLLLTAIAIVLGVGSVSGTFVPPRTLDPEPGAARARRRLPLPT